MQNNKIKNSETPFFSTSPVQDQFNQLIVAFGVTKREKMAMELFIREHWWNTKNEISINESIEKCYKIADMFLNFEEKSQKENSSKIIL